MLSAIFVASGIEGLRRPGGMVEMAEPQATQLASTLGLPTDPELLVRINSGVHVGAGILLAVGKFRRLAALALFTSLIPTTWAAHRFWEEQDEATKAQQQVHFFKNLGLMGGLILAAVDTEGAPSLGWRARRRASQAGTVIALGGKAARAGGDGGKKGRKAAKKAAKAGKAATKATAKAVAAREVATAKGSAGKEKAAAKAQKAAAKADKTREKTSAKAEKMAARAAKLAAKGRSVAVEATGKAGAKAAKAATKAVVAKKAVGALSDHDFSMNGKGRAGDLISAGARKAGDVASAAAERLPVG
jgi:uncharacterized membrane protein YphA (DoxX/SURF4 family)